MFDFKYRLWANTCKPRYYKEGTLKNMFKDFTPHEIKLFIKENQRIDVLNKGTVVGDIDLGQLLNSEFYGNEVIA